MMNFRLGSFAAVLLCLNIVSLQYDTGTDAAPLDQQQNAEIIKYENSNIGVDGYDFAFETSDGVSRKESATLKNVGTEKEAISVQGTVSWVGPDGVEYTLNYLADENGFQPEGDHLPVSPEA